MFNMEKTEVSRIFQTTDNSSIVAFLKEWSHLQGFEEAAIAEIEMKQSLHLVSQSNICTFWTA